MDQFLTATEVAEMLKVKEMTVREMFRSGRLRGFKIGKSWRTTLAMLQEDLDGMRQSQLCRRDAEARERKYGNEEIALQRRQRGRPRKDDRAEDIRPEEKVPTPLEQKKEEPVADSQTYLF